MRSLNGTPLKNRPREPRLAGRSDGCTPPRRAARIPSSL
jgi:hypothetical protein